MQETSETWVQSLGRKDPLEEEMATHSNVLAWRWHACMSFIVEKNKTQGSPYFCLKLNMHFSKCVLYFLEAVFWLPWGIRIFLIKGG